MRHRTFGAVALLAAAGAAAAIAAAPMASADPPCDPAVVSCPGGGAVTPPESGGGSMDFAPAVQAPGDDYPADGDWFFSSPGPNEPAYSTGNGPRGGGGGHR